jgi:hypothetical protein
LAIELEAKTGNTTTSIPLTAASLPAATALPIFIPSKGRSDQRLGTWAILESSQVPFTVVVEPQECADYLRRFGLEEPTPASEIRARCEAGIAPPSLATVCCLPANGRGVAFVRNFILHELAPRHRVGGAHAALLPAVQFAQSVDARYRERPQRPVPLPAGGGVSVEWIESSAVALTKATKTGKVLNDDRVGTPTALADLSDAGAAPLNRLARAGASGVAARDDDDDDGSDEDSVTPAAATTGGADDGSPSPSSDSPLANVDESTGAWFWIMDDDVRHFFFTDGCGGFGTKCTSSKDRSKQPAAGDCNCAGRMLREVHRRMHSLLCCDRGRHPMLSTPIAMFGLEYEQFAFASMPDRFLLNSYVNICACLNLARLPPQIRYRFRVREDYDLVLQAIRHGACVLRFKDIAFRAPSMREQKGGMTPYYEGQQGGDIPVQNGLFLQEWGGSALDGRAIVQEAVKGSGQTLRRDIRVRWAALRDTGCAPSLLRALAPNVVARRPATSAAGDGAAVSPRCRADLCRMSEDPLEVAMPPPAPLDARTAATWSTELAGGAASSATALAGRKKGARGVAGKRRRRRSSDSDEDDSAEDSESGMTTSDDEDVVALSDDGGASAASAKRNAAARVRAPRVRPPPKTAEQLAHERQWRGYEAIMYRVVTPAAEAVAGLVRLDGREGRAVPRPGMTAVAVPWEPERPVLLVGSILSVQQRGGAATSGRKTAAARAERDTAAASTPITYEVTLCPSSRGLGVYTGSDVFAVPGDVDAARVALEAYFNGSDPVEEWHAAAGGVNLGYLGSRV